MRPNKVKAPLWKPDNIQTNNHVFNTVLFVLLSFVEVYTKQRKKRKIIQLLKSEIIYLKVQIKIHYYAFRCYILYDSLNGLCIATKDNLFKHFFKICPWFKWFLWNEFSRLKQIRILNGLLLLQKKFMGIVFLFLYTQTPTS